MGLWSRLGGALGGVRRLWRSTDSTLAGEEFFTGALISTPTATGIQINQQTAMQVATVLACVSILAEDVSKMTPRLFRRRDDNKGRDEVKDHWLADLLWQPNTWQTWPEFCRQMVVAFLLRGNGYAVIIRDGRGRPVMLVPINPDRVALWQSPDGSLFWMVTRNGLHELAVLRDLPLLIPYEDVLHLKDLSADGLVGLSRITLAREAIALAAGQEQQQARLIGNGARPSGILTTEQKLTPEIAKRAKDNWQAAQGGIVNTGKTAVLEAGLKWQALSLNSVDLQFLQLRQFQIVEICRLFRVPPHMVGAELGRGAMQQLVQQGQDYRNNTLTSHTDVWERRFDFTFSLRRQGLFVDFDEGQLLKADLVARYNAYRIAKFGGWLNTNEIRIAEGMNSIGPEGEAYWQPNNMLPENAGDVAGSAASGEAPTGAGQPHEDDGTDPDATDQAPSI